MGKKMEWDEFKNDWRKADIYPEHFEVRALCSLSKSDLEKDDKMNKLFNADFNAGVSKHFAKTFKQAG